MKIVERGLIYDSRGKPEAQRSACFADLCRTAAGVFFATFQMGPAKNAASSTLGLCRSRDQGRTWQRLPGNFATRFAGISGSLAVGAMTEAEPDRLLLLATWIDRSEPERPLFDPVTEGILRTKILKAFSTDQGESWSEWEEVPFAGLGYCPHGSGPIVRWADGTIALAFESHKAFDDPDPDHREVQASWLLVSKDAGRTFDRPYQVAQDPAHQVYYWDQRVCAGKRSDEYFALFWTHDRSAGRDLNVHLKRGRLSRGSGGREEIVATVMPGQIAVPFLGPDWRLFALVVDRRRPGRIVLWEASAAGQTWREAAAVYEHQGPHQSAYGADTVKYAEVWETLEKWRFGHPAIQVLTGQEALVTYYAGTEADLSVHWARLDLSP